MCKQLILMPHGKCPYKEPGVSLGKGDQFWLAALGCNTKQNCLCIHLLKLIVISQVIPELLPADEI